jgi:hypothetical protein
MYFAGEQEKVVDLNGGIATRRVCIPSFGEVAEWPMAHAWKACTLKGVVGSNPTLSANLEGAAERPATGLENQGRVKPEGSIPSPSANLI